MSQSPEAAPIAVASVTVLMATRDGMRWLPEQLTSILDQQHVDVHVIALDDESTDGTGAWLLAQAEKEPRLTVLEPMGASGSAAANFYRLIRHAPVAAGSLVAFADQDDLWMPGKLARHAELLSQGYDGVSSDVTAFDSAGRRTLIRKSYPQVDFDYLLESPGPGSTFLISPRLFELTRRLLDSESSTARQADFHDCLVYAIARASGWRWLIDDVVSVDYRQHDENVRGANVGLSSAVERWHLVRNRWHRRQALVLAAVGLEVAPPAIRQPLERMHGLLGSHGFRARQRLASQSGQLRRRRRDQRIIGLLIVLGIW
ncbi:MAG: Rhamnosyltransferase [Rhodoglobus sp.]|nr:Rhamnosyltransferase [Rhodoglobus sp.]